ncbi:meiosis protein SPO22/ZIP4 like-domain-containing protein [Scheffersomyces coipomensis]|uniref:meiosis protein SPO22/ZIP4 like-domain-containing protein n=1 Tax=Scheffersomyces coipomensis TaxID=1788519 RepID=UPI00315DE123
MSELESNISTSIDEFIRISNEIAKSIESSKDLSENQILPIQSKLDVVLSLSESLLKSSNSINQYLPLSNEVRDIVEATASNLWNISSITSRVIDSQKIQLFLCQVKLFALVLLQIYDRSNFDHSKLFRSTNCAIKLFSSCIDFQFNDVAKKVQTYGEASIARLIELDKDDKLGKEDKSKIYENTSKMLILSMNHSLIIKDYVMTKLYETKLDKINLAKHAKVEFLSDCSRYLFNGSLELYEHENFEKASEIVSYSIKYLQVNDLNYKAVINDYDERLFQSYLLYIKCLQKVPNSSNKVQEILKYLMENFSNRVEVYILKLEEYQDFEESEIKDLVMTLVVKVPLENNLEKILGLLRNICQKSIYAVNKCMDYMLTKLDPIKSHDQLELIVSTKVYFNTNIINSAKTIVELNSFLKLAERTFTKSISQSSRSSIVTLIWNQGTKSLKAQKYSVVIEWYNLCLSRILVDERDEGDENGKIIRSLQNSHFLLNNYQSAIDCVEQMNEKHKSSILTQYNLFRCYIKLNNVDLAIETIERMSSREDPLSVVTLAVCVIESKGILPTSMSLNLMFKLLSLVMNDDNYKNESSTGSDYVVIPIAIRCTIVMVLKGCENESDTSIISKHFASLLEIFTKSLSVAKKNSSNKVKKSQKFTVDDLEWLSSKAYNIACTAVKHNQSSTCLSFAQFAKSFITLIPHDIGAQKLIELQIWDIKSNILIMLATILKGSETSWNEIREAATKDFESINRLLTSNEIGENQLEDCKSCRIQLILFRFQAELESGLSDNLHGILEQVPTEDKVLDFTIYSTIVALVLKSNRNQVKYKLLSEIIIKSLELGSNFSLISIWIRKLFEDHSLTGENHELVISHLISILKCLDQEETFPPFEIDWLASTCWNSGVTNIM